MKRFHCFVVALAALGVSWCVLAADVAPANPNAWRHKNWEGEINIPTGHYRGPDKGVHTERHTHIVVAPGTLIEGGRFSCDNGSIWNVERSLFRKVDIASDAGSRFEAKDSVFDDCVLHKGGVWSVAMWSTRWSYDNCVFAKRFIPGRWNVGTYSVRAIGCTFYDIALPKIEYKDDPSK